MKSFLYFLLAGSLALGACGQDPLQEMTPDASTDNADGSASGVPEGTFLVDYSVDNGSATRATGDGKLQISSLDYYVYYKAGGELLKHRRIAIDPTAQEWPMTRENMTWEQRQALQDTLQCGVDYRILFIANVDSTLFNYDDYSETNPHSAVVKEDENYSTARILLPNVPFHDNNMYCLWEGELAASTDAAAYYDQAVINRTDIILQRIVTRTDISRASDEEKTSLDEAVKGFYETYCKTNVESAVNTWINDFCTRINNCATEGHPLYDIRDYSTQIKSLTEILKQNQNLVIDTYSDQIIKRYVAAIETSAIYTTRMQQWAKDGRTVRAVYADGTRANAIGFNRTALHVAEGIDSNVNEAACNMSEDGTVSIIGFARPETEAVKNEVVSLDFYDDDVLAFQIKGTDATFEIAQGINWLREVVCDPANKINFLGSNYDAEDSVNLTEILKDVQEWNQIFIDNPNLKGVINKEFFGGCNYLPAGSDGHAGADFKDCSFENFPIHVSLPDITAENVDTSIELIPAWTPSIVE